MILPRAMGLGRGLGELWTPHEKHCFYLLQRVPSPPAATLLQIHGSLLRRGILRSNLSLLTGLISAFSSLAALAPPLAASALLRHVRRLFDDRATQDAVLCNSFIIALVRNRRFLESLAIYRELLRELPSHSPVEPSSFPDDYTFPFLLKSCASIPGDPLEHREGHQIHSHVIKMGFFGHRFSSTALVDMYAKNGDMTSARKVFDGMPLKSLPSWTSMTVGYARAGDVGAAMGLFQLMPEKDAAAFNAMIDVFVKQGNMASAKRLFDEMDDRNVVSWTSLISGYCKVGNTEAAGALFDLMPLRNLYSWNVMIGGYSQNRQPHRALELFREMQSSSCLLQPDDVTLVSVLPAVADLGAIDIGRWIHNYAQRKGLDQLITVSTALVDMYAKCGDICEARRVFDIIPSKETPAWNAMIYGLALNGQSNEALDLFAEMRRLGASPNELTMIGVLSACSHGGLVHEAKKWFGEMEVFNVERRMEHYGCMVDILGRSGYLEEAEKLIDEMPNQPNGIVLSSLLSACVFSGDVERAERVMSKANAVEPGNARNYVMMRNLYARANRWGDVNRIKEDLTKLGGKKEAGCSVIQVASSVCEFVSGDRAHPEWESIASMLVKLLLHIQGQGDDWDLDLVDSEEEDRHILTILANDGQSKSFAAS